ncbi:hypothetical protein OPIT5_17605 [Opitutaceae bacterium TAV5]|nr:hypothetical protein OPIT5_17605 [Opitutaceae bacterium TAV5]
MPVFQNPAGFRPAGFFFLFRSGAGVSPADGEAA